MPAVAINVEQVRGVISTLSPDVVIQMFIDAVEEGVGVCYSSLSTPLQTILKTHLVAYFVELSTGASEINSIGSPNGASVSYGKNMKDNLGGSPYGRVVLNLDTKACWVNMITMTTAVNVTGGPG